MPTSSAPTFDPGIGFADPVLQSQAAFRAILAALSEPGTIHALGEAVAVPTGLRRGTGITLLTLADYETPVWLDEARRAGEPGAWLRFHATTPLVASPAEAAFAVIDGGASEPRLAAFNKGTDLFPDRAATVLVECAALEGGEAVSLSGPGIPETRSVAPQGLRPGFWAEIQENGALYPLGIDVILVAGDRIMGLPRSTLVNTTGGLG